MIRDPLYNIERLTAPTYTKYLTLSAKFAADNEDGTRLPLAKLAALVEAGG